MENVKKEEELKADPLTKVSTVPMGKTYFVKGAPGTGKSVLAVYLIKKLTDIFQKKSDTTDLETVDPFYVSLKKIRESEFKIGFDIPQTPLRQTLRSVFKQTEGMNPKMILGPNDVSKDYYDLLIVDESHRLNRRNQLTGYKAYDDVNRRLNFSKETTQLDWVLAQSTYQILIYDPEQTVCASDVLGEDFKKLMNSPRAEVFNLNSQMHVAGGNNYIKYIEQLFSDNPPELKIDFAPQYQFRLFDSVKEMVDQIQKLQGEYGLYRILAGYSWKWKTKGQVL